MPLSSFCVGQVLPVMQSTLKSHLFSQQDSLGEKKIFISRRLWVEIASGLGMGHVSTSLSSSRTPLVQIPLALCLLLQSLSSHGGQACCV